MAARQFHGAAAPGRILVPGAARRLARRGLQHLLERAGAADRLFWRLPEPLPAVALTFDDGPDPEQTPRILDVLAGCGARATFFLVGEAALRHPTLVRRIAAEGHSIGNHTHRHVSCRHLTCAALDGELERADAAITRFLPGWRLTLFRPPWGAIRPAQAWMLVRAGWRVALWNQDSGDYRGARGESIAALGSRLCPRDVVLLHDRFPATLEGLPALLRRLGERGIGTATLDRPEEAVEPGLPGTGES